MIEIKDLSFKYPNSRMILNNINLHIKTGEFVVFTGKNGCGKSTLLKLLNGLLIPTQGTIFINGLDTQKKENLFNIRQNVGMVFQNPDTQFIGRIVEEDVAFGLENLGINRKYIKKKVYDTLQMLNLLDISQKTISSLSGGQKQKVAVAGIIVMQPECIIFDEITSMLDYKSQKDIIKIVKQIHKSGKTILYATHKLEEVFYADRIIIMDNGKIVVDDNLENVFLQDLEKYGLKIPDIIQLSKILLKAGIIESPLPLTDKHLIKRLCP